LERIKMGNNTGQKGRGEKSSLGEGVVKQRGKKEGFVTMDISK